MTLSCKTLAGGSLRASAVVFPVILTKVVYGTGSAGCESQRDEAVSQRAVSSVWTAESENH